MLSVFVLATIGSIAGLAGGVLLLFQKKSAAWLSQITIPFAAGVLLTATFINLLPEATKNVDTGLLFLVVLATILSSFFIEQLLVQFHHHKGKQISLKESVPLLVLGDTIHNFIDGVVIAASYILSPELGLVVAIATFLHELPHEIGDFGLMLAAGWSRTKTLWVNFFSALATYLGVGTVFILPQLSTQFIGVILGIASGIFIYIAVSDLLPEVEKSIAKNKRWPEALLVLGGVVIMWLLNLILPT